MANIVAQFAERTVLTPKVGGSNPVIGKHLFRTFVTIDWNEKTKIKKKRPGMAHF